MSDEKEHWHLDKKLNVGHLLTTLSLAGALIVWGMNMESRINVHQSEIESIKEHSKESNDRLISAIDKIDNKLDRLIERR